MLIQSFTTIALSIFLEGLFFLLIGAIVSSIIEVFVPEETIQKLIPKNKYVALLLSSSLGLILPICECGIIPVIHRLLKKKVPLYICITLLFSSPIVNILVIISTYFAFNDYLYIVLLRIFGGFIISFIIGFVVSLSFKTDEVMKDNFTELKVEACSCNHHAEHSHDHEGCGCQHDHNHEQKKNKNIGLVYKLKPILSHSIDEFFDTGKYFIIGIIITALIQSLVPRNNLATFGNLFPFSNLFMIGFPYLLSNCSNTDAFIARSFLGSFSVSSIVTFMIFGAMFDIKTTIMLKKIFRVSFIIRLLLLVIALNLLFSLFIEFFFKG